MCFVCLQCKFKKRNLTGDMEDRSHGTSQYKEIIFLLMSVAMTRSDVWDRYPSINRSDHLSSDAGKWS